MTDQRDAPPQRRYSRRSILQRASVGAGIAALGTTESLASARTALASPPEKQAAPDGFGRIFKLPAFAKSSPAVVDALLEIGRPGGVLDASDALERGPVDLIVDPALSANNPNNPTSTAGATFVGQFMDHDLTFDPVSRLGIRPGPDAKNFRTPAFDLDSVYGRGPIADLHLYEPADGAKLKLESGGLFEDLPRSADGRAIIADPRNDENLILSGLHSAFLCFHNRGVDYLRARGVIDPVELYLRARRLTTWHYQWLILHEFLPQFVGKALVDLILARGRRFYTVRRDAFMPVEFQAAAFRFGHSLVRPSYRANLAGDRGKPFFGFVFDVAEAAKPDPGDMSGGVRAPRRFIGWQTFFDFGDGEVKPNKRVDTKISTPLFNLPGGVIPGLPGLHRGPTALAQRNFLRHLTWELPSGQRIAKEMGAPMLSRSDLQELGGLGVGFDRQTPLWYYVLKEAEIVADGLHLGPVGGRIVAEVIIGLLKSDPGSYLAVEPRWRPSLPSRVGGGDFRMTDFLTFAGVDPASRGQ